MLDAIIAKYGSLGKAAKAAGCSTISLSKAASTGRSDHPGVVKLFRDSGFVLKPGVAPGQKIHKHPWRLLKAVP